MKEMTSRRYLNEAHRRYTEATMKAVKEMSKRGLSREEMKNQCDRIYDASLLPKKIQIPNRQNRDLYLEQTPDDIYQYELKGRFKGLTLLYDEEKKTFDAVYLWNDRLLFVADYFETFKVTAITYLKEENRIFVRLAVPFW